MKKVDDILKEMNPKSLYQYSEPFMNKPSFTQDDYQLVNELFKTIIGFFPAFKQAWPADAEFEQAKREWMKAFKQVGLNDMDDIKRGVDKFRILANPFVPSPGQFIEMCKKEVSLVPPMYQGLPIMKAQVEIQKAEVAKMKALLGIKNN